MSLNLAQIRRLLSRCDPQKPLKGGSAFYVSLDAARGERACVDRLQRTILTSEERSCQLFTGFPGTGKTTELRRLEHRLVNAQAPENCHVLFVNFDDYIDRYRPLAITDILRVLAFAVSAEADRVEKAKTPPGEAYLRDFFETIKGWLPKNAELRSMAFEVYGVKFMAELRANPSVYEQVEAALRLRFQQFAEECQAKIQSGIKRIQDKLYGRAERFLIIADGLEKIEPLDGGTDERKVVDSLVSLFVAHSELLKIPCHVIYTFPVWLRFRTSQLGSLYEGEPLTLPMVKIRGRDGVAHEEGIELLSTLLARRLDSSEDVFGDNPRAALRRIVEKSGGYPRDALRLVRNLLRTGEVFPVPDTAIERAIAELRAVYHDKILATDADLLAQIADTHRRPDRDSEQLHRFGKLFTDFLVFAYRNGEEWFALHPLVEDAPALLEYRERQKRSQ